MLITAEGFIEVVVTPDMMRRAEEKAGEMGELRNSIRHGQGNVAGFLGEEVVKSVFTGSAEQNTFQHDIVFEEVSFEVKTKDRTVVPALDYEASVANHNTRQRADFYVFTSLLRNKVSKRYEKCYVLGLIEKTEYFDKATFLRKGDVDPVNGWMVSTDCYNLPYASLSRFESWRTNDLEIKHVL